MTFKEFKERVFKGIEQGGLSVLLYAEGRAKVYVPVDTSNLQKSISNTGFTLADTGLSRARINASAKYAAPVEFGHLTKPFAKTSGVQNFVKAQPFMRPAVADAVDNGGDIMVAAIQEQLS